MAVLVTEGLIKSGTIVNDPIIAAQIDKQNRKKSLAEKSKQLQREANDAKAMMEKYKSRLADMVALAKLNPSYANMAGARAAADGYSLAAANYIGALYAAEYAAAAAEGAGIVVASRDAGAKVSPSVEAAKNEIKAVERNYAEIVKVQTGQSAKTDFVADMMAQSDLAASTKRAETLFSIAKMSSSTMDDAMNLVASVEQLRAQRKATHVSWRDNRIAEIMDASKHKYADTESCEAAARNKVAKELRKKRRAEDKSGERRERIKSEKEMRMFGLELIAFYNDANGKPDPRAKYAEAKQENLPQESKGRVINHGAHGRGNDNLNHRMAIARQHTRV